MRTLAQVNLEIQKIEKIGALQLTVSGTTGNGWIPCMKKRRLLMEGEHSSGSRPEEMPSGN